MFVLPNLEAGGAERVTLNIIEQLDRSVFDIFLLVLNQRGDLHELISKDIDNLLMAGRNISGDFIAHSSYRVTGNAVEMGEAAGKFACQRL